MCIGTTKVLKHMFVFLRNFTRHYTRHLIKTKITFKINHDLINLTKYEYLCRIYVSFESIFQHLRLLHRVTLAKW